MEQSIVAARQLVGILASTLIGVVVVDACRENRLPLAPAAGLPRFQEIAALAVPGGLVNVAGGNLLVRRVDLSIDTRLGEFSIGASWNSASAAWLWSFEIAYDGAGFLDPTGAFLPTDGLVEGYTIAGTHWVKIDGRKLETKGGLRYEFAADGSLQAMHWRSAAHPRLEFVKAVVAGSSRIAAIDQCASPGVCQRVFAIHRDAWGRVVRITDRAERVASFDYDAAGCLVAARDGLDHAQGWPGWRYEYGGDGLLTAVVNAEGERIEYQYTGRSLAQARRIGAMSPTFSFVYHPAVNGLYATSFHDPLGHAFRFEYDASRRLRVSRVEARGEITRFGWNGRAVASVTSPAGAVVSFVHDAGEDPVVERTASGNQVRIDYAPGAVNRGAPWERAVRRVEDALGFLEERVYDARGRLVAVRNGAGETFALDYDEEEMIGRVTTPAGVVTTFEDYGEDGHPRRQTVGDPATAEGSVELGFVYDAVGNLVEGGSFAEATSPGRSGIRARAFDADRNLRELQLDDSQVPVTDPERVRTLRLEHRSDGRPLRVIRPYGGDTQFVYDPLGRLVEHREKVDGGWHATVFEYDAAGQRTAMELANRMRREWEYDAVGRVVQERALWGGAPESSVAFDYQDGHLVSILDLAHGSPETFAYDAGGRPIEVGFPGGERVTLHYDVRDRLVQEIYWLAGGDRLRSIGYGYDAAGRRTRVTDGQDLLVEGTHAGGRLREERFGNGLVRTYQYDPQRGWLTSTQTVTSTGDRVETTTLETSFGRLLQWHGLTVRTSTELGLVAHSEEWYALTRAPQVPGAPLAGLRLIDEGDGIVFPVLLHDALGNLSTLVLAPESRAMLFNPERNRLLEVSDPVSGVLLHRYAHDAAGYVIERDGQTLTWTAAGRIASVGHAASFTWDGQDRKIQQTVQGVTTRWLYGDRVEARADGTPTALDLGGVRIDLQGSRILYRHKDFRGNVKFTTDERGAVVAHYAYGGYGLRDIQGEPGSVEANLGFAEGRSYAGLDLLGARLYEPDAGRFLSPDPRPAIVNAFAYTMGNPIHFWDPSGRESRITSKSTWILTLRIKPRFRVRFTTRAGNVELGEMDPGLEWVVELDPREFRRRLEDALLPSLTGRFLFQTYGGLGALHGLGGPDLHDFPAYPPPGCENGCLPDKIPDSQGLVTPPSGSLAIVGSFGGLHF